MKTLYIECNMGAAGDMLTAALSELLDDPDSFVATMNAAGIPGLRMARVAKSTCGILGTHMRMEIGGEEELCPDLPEGAPEAEAREFRQEIGHGHEHGHEYEYEYEHDHGHEHEHEHSHEHEHAHEHEDEHEHAHDHAPDGYHYQASPAEVCAQIDGLNLPEEMRAEAKRVYDEQEHEHEDEHEHAHEHDNTSAGHHYQASPAEVCAQIDGLNLPEKMRAEAKRVYDEQEHAHEHEDEHEHVHEHDHDSDGHHYQASPAEVCAQIDGLNLPEEMRAEAKRVYDEQEHEHEDEHEHAHEHDNTSAGHHYQASPAEVCAQIDGLDLPEALRAEAKWVYDEPEHVHEHEHAHEHEDEHEHAHDCDPAGYHYHASLAEVCAQIDGLNLPEELRTEAKQVYDEHEHAHEHEHTHDPDPSGHRHHASVAEVCAQIDGLNLPEAVRAEAKWVYDEQEHAHEHEHEHAHEHDHAPGGHHYHASLAEVCAQIDGLNLSEEMRVEAKRVYDEQEHEHEHEDEHEHVHEHDHDSDGHHYQASPAEVCAQIDGLNLPEEMRAEAKRVYDEQEHAYEDEHEHAHEHAHDHVPGGHHHHASLAEVCAQIDDLNLPEEVRAEAKQVYSLLAEAEAHVHGCDAESLHFHEVGMLDAITDVCAVCLEMHLLRPERVVVSPIHTGFGQVRCAHGVLPVPTPATAYILRDMPASAGSVRGELLTPTGAALLKHFATEFGWMPAMRTQKLGCGVGTKEFPAANCVRAFLGDDGAEDGNGAEDGDGAKGGNGAEDGDCAEGGNGAEVGDGAKGGDGAKSGNGAKDSDGAKDGDGAEGGYGAEDGDCAEDGDKAEGGNDAKRGNGAKNGDGTEGDDGAKRGNSAEGGNGAEDGDGAERGNGAEDGDGAKGGSGAKDGDCAEGGDGAEDDDCAEGGNGAKDGDCAEGGDGAKDGNGAEGGNGAEDGDGAKDGNGAEGSNGVEDGDAYEIRCNLDDMTGEAIGFAAEELMRAGALDVWLTPIQMKKGRPGVQLNCLCRPEDRRKLEDAMLHHTTSIGVRGHRVARRTLPRKLERVDTPYGEIGVKRSTGDGFVRVKPEYEDAAEAARRAGVPLAEVLRAAEQNLME